MMRVLVRIFAVVGLIVVLLITGTVAALWAFSPGQGKVPDQVVLEFDFEQPLAERVPDDPLVHIFGGTPRTLHHVVTAIDRAAADDRVKGLIARTGEPMLGWAATQELRDAITRFRAAGKFALIHTESLGESGSGMASYYLASAFDEIWMQPVGMVAVNGLMAELPSLRGLMDKLHLQPDLSKRHEYKTAAEPFMEYQATEPNREMTTAILGDVFDQWLGDVAQGRGLTTDQVRQAVDRAPLLDREALELGLVDRLAYYDEAMEAVLERAGDPDMESMDLIRYGHIAGPAAPADAPMVAVIIGSGPIYRGSGGSDPLFGEPSFGPDDIAAAFEEAVENTNVRAILFRVESPGGSPVGSEVVRRAVRKAREAGKPVIVSMADVAASGGYWVSMDADRIVAQPSTLTGSIGVLYGKVVTSGLRDWAGIHTTRIAVGANAGMWSSGAPFTETERARLNAMLDDIYDRFTAGVAEGRNLPLDRVREIARGRVYTGRQALELGLVDALGGYDVAMNEVREAIGLAPGAPVRTLVYPEPRSQWEYLMELTSSDVRAHVASALLSRRVGEVLTGAEPVLKGLAPWLTAPSVQDTMVLMPPLVITGAGR